MDLWIKPSSENLKKLGATLADLMYSQDTIKDILDSRPMNHPTPIRIFSEDEKFKVDLMTSIFYEPLTFDVCRERAIESSMNGFILPIVGIKDLIDIKSNTNRKDGNFKDLVDAHELRKILERGKTLDIQKRESVFKKMFKKPKKDENE